MTDWILFYNLKIFFIFVKNLEMVDVYGFGHVLYELVYGQPLLTASYKVDFNDCPHRELKQVLDMILVEEVLAKSGPPTINQLLELSFFKYTQIDPLPSSSSLAAGYASTNNKLFTSTKTKEALMKAREFIERRFVNEQKQACFRFEMFL